MSGPFRILLLILGAVLVVVLGWLALQNKRRLDRRVHDFLEEQAEKGPTDPYMALAELYAEDEREKQKSRDRRKWT